MRVIRILLFLVVAAAVAACIPAFFPSLIWQAPKTGPESSTADAAKGAYLFAMSGCAGCHTRKDGSPLAGGREIASPFGVFVSPNITPDSATGIGGWMEADFIRAMTLGLSPDERHYYPAFPYVSYTRMTLEDLRDLWAYLKSIPPVTSRTAGHRLAFPYSVRPGLGLWEAAVSRARPIPPGPRQIAKLEPRRLYRDRPGPLRRMPHAAQHSGRPAQQRATGRRARLWRRQDEDRRRPQHHAAQEEGHRLLEPRRSGLCPADRGLRRRAT